MASATVALHHTLPAASTRPLRLVGHAITPKRNPRRIRSYFTRRLFQDRDSYPHKTPAAKTQTWRRLSVPHEIHREPLANSGSCRTIPIPPGFCVSRTEAGHPALQQFGPALVMAAFVSTKPSINQSTKSCHQIKTTHYVINKALKRQLGNAPDGPNTSRTYIAMLIRYYQLCPHRPNMKMPTLNSASSTGTKQPQHQGWYFSTVRPRSHGPENRSKQKHIEKGGVVKAPASIHVIWRCQ
ncbi:hypothetical protein Purlil1_1586 [Purpureocillium lilacinum]|uniref:Uncharacterized protein n=1 Tax=Purpureocillium lilacinum TaxID=33203 RepID=A0ABR0CCY8_PURLI|nr:hypothetical protein Purlil1_1586 [Purpureocillium lilacinum]